MNEPVVYTRQDNIAILTINNPAANALSEAVSKGLVAGLEQAIADQTIAAVVITATGSLFSSGADMAEFKTAPKRPHLLTLFSTIEASPKAVIAAINGAAIGAGTELALACHYRLAHRSASLALPEVQLGLIPGGGGTQRLPRLCGVERALTMIITGKSMGAIEAHAADMVDLLLETSDDFLQQAISYATELVNKGMGPRNLRDQVIDPHSIPAEFFNHYRNAIAAKTKGYFAPERCIQAVEAAVSLPFDQGLEREFELFMECLGSLESESLRHLFFAERQTSKIADVPGDTPTRIIEKVAVIGAGTMGGGIAMNFLNAGLPVTILEREGEALDRGLGMVHKNYQASAKRGRLTEAQVEERMGRLSGTLDYKDLADADLVIEAVFENIEVKQSVFRELDRVCKPGAILASNTSTLDLDKIASATRRPQDVIGLHFFSPANVMPLLEIIRGEKTATDVIATSMKLAKKIRKTGVLVGVCFGFVANRMLEPYVREASRLVLEGASPAQVDQVITELGFPMGPFAMGDLAGLDINCHARECFPQITKGDPSYGVVSDRLVAMGRLGQKTGHGAYIYDPGSRKPKFDPEVMEIARREAERLGIKQRQISNQEILERCIYTLINEGAQILDEGIAQRASDIDVIYVKGYGFPPYLGGPMHYANRIGVDRIYDALCQYRDKLGDYGKLWFEPAPLLEKIAHKGGRFGDH